ncbi:MAG: heterodisulfide reductase-related iron-sulfur binding cluster [Desulfobacterota bacterium]|nr:heterodisulfide reductase-related iron-sulfur binding cluster [Thermodesulfobacteriota bacterium]
MYPKINKKVYERTLEDYREMAWGDARCNWCMNQWGWNVKSSKYNEICPEFRYTRFFGYSAMGKFHIIRALIEGDFDYTDSEKLLEICYFCTSCGACEMNCLRLNEKEPLKAAEALKARLIELGIAPLPAHKELLKSIKNYDNPWLQPRSRRRDWAKELDVPAFSKDACEYLFFAGCTPAFDPLLQHEIVNTMRVLKRAGVTVGIFGEQEICCGSPAIRLGDRQTFFDLVRRNIELFKNAGVKKIITHCAGCHHVLKYDFPEVPDMPAYDIEILHVSQVLADLVRKGTVTFTKKVPMTVTWHDPCHIGRHCGIYEEPRDILRAIPGIKLIEMERIKDQAWCCGAGAGVRTAFPELSFKIASERIEEAKETGAEAIATCCPYCEQSLSDPLKRNREKLKLYDLTDIMLMAL